MKKEIEFRLDHWVKVLEKAEAKNNMDNYNKAVLMVQYYEAMLEDFSE